MKVLLFLTLVLLGCSLAEEQEEAEVSSLQDIMEDDTARQAQDPTKSVTIAQVDIINAINELLNNPGDKIDLPGLDLGAATTATTAAITGIIGTITAIKSALTGLLLKPLGVAIDVLAIIALVLLIKYLVENKGDVKGLIGHSGYADSGYDYSGSSSYASTGASGHYRRSAGARSLFDTPAVQLLTNVVYDAIENYSQ